MISPNAKYTMMHRLLTVPGHYIHVFALSGVFAHAMNEKIDIRLNETLLSSQGFVAESMREVASHSRMSCFIGYENRAITVARCNAIL